jgi:hypothetical protein
MRTLATGLPHEADLAGRVDHWAHCEIEGTPTGGQAHHDLLPQCLPRGNQRDGRGNLFRHARRAGEPRRFPERLADQILQPCLDPRQRGWICVEQNASGGIRPWYR